MINEPELRMREISLYRSYYCGLCEDLLESYGRPGQLTLSYDTTFLGFLLTCLYEPEDETFEKASCIAHPFSKRPRRRNKYTQYAAHAFRKHPMRRNACTQYAADLTVLLAYYSMRDDWEDEKKLRGLAFSGLLQSAYRKASSRYPQKEAAIRDCLDRLHSIENAQNPPDQAADMAGGCFGELMAELFAYRQDVWEEPLRRTGFFLGKYIDLLDAYDDLEKDEKSGNFNPLLPVQRRMIEQGADFDAYVRSLLTMLMASCTRAFETLPIVENIDILRNILYAGVWIKFEEIFARRTGQDQS